MKRFRYKAKEKSTGKPVKGVIQAESERSAGQILVEQGYIPESVKEDGVGLFGVRGRVATKSRIMFTRQLSILIGAGLPLVTSLRTVVDQTEDKAMRSVGEDIIASVESGNPLYESFAAHPDVFDNVYVSLIQAGEASGTLDNALKRLADQEEKDAAMLSKIKGALVYPAIILVVIIAVLAFMMIMVVPEVQKLYADMGEELPGLTQALVNLTDFFADFWWLVAIVLGATIGGLYYFIKKTPGGRKVMDSIKIHAPLFGGLFRKLYVSRFARTSEMLLATGVPMLESVKIAIASTSNTIIEGEYTKCLDVIKSGKPLSEALTDVNYMLPLVPQMASIGEQSGKIDEMLGRAAGVYEEELDNQINNISTMIEPILMVAMAGVIGIVVGGTLLPIYSLVNKVAS